MNHPTAIQLDPDAVVIYAGGDDLLVSLPTNLIGQFLRGFASTNESKCEGYSYSNTTRRRFGNNPIQDPPELDGYTYSFVEISVDIVKQDTEQGPTKPLKRIAALNIIMKLLEHHAKLAKTTSAGDLEVPVYSPPPALGWDVTEKSVYQDSILKGVRYHLREAEE